MTIIPLSLEKWRSARDQRMYNATIHELQYGDLRQFFRITSGMAANNVHANDPDRLSETTFDRFAWRDISSDQVLKLSCLYNRKRWIDLKQREPIKVPIEQGEKTITIPYSLDDFGLQDFIQKGLNPLNCEFVWTKEWTLHLAPNVDRIYQVQSNTFRIVTQ